MPKIAFIGSGRMASAIVEGLLAKKVSTPADLACVDGGDDTARQLAARTGVGAPADLASLLGPADTIVLACKPQQLAGLDPRIADLSAGRLVLSILAGKKLASLARVFPKARNIIRAMPNTPGQIGAGISAWSSLPPLAPADRTIADSILGALGQVVELPEDQLDAVTGLSGSGPAYVFEFTAALRDAGVAAGLSRDVAWKLALETVLGSARLMARTGTEPEVLRDQVTSPNGTTYAGLQRMKARDFRGLIKETVVTATERSRELSKD
jgi:pyrroline-5-carboxylate reductase